MQMLKHKARGSDVTAVQVTADNLADVAAEAGGDVFTSPRDDTSYVVVETGDGSRRAEAGTWLVRREAGEDVWYEVLADDDFQLQYERP